MTRSLTFYICILLLHSACTLRKNINPFNYLICRNEILEYQERTVLNDTTIIESKFLWNNNGKMCWFDSINTKTSSYNRFNFKFNLSNDTLFLEYANFNKINKLPFFSIKFTDTLDAINFNELQNGNIQYVGNVTYQGIQKIHLLGGEITCFVFEINEGIVRSNTRKSKIKEYYLTTKELIPVQIITKLIVLKTGVLSSKEELQLVKLYPN